MAGIPDCTLTTACYFLQQYHVNARGMSETVESMEPLLRIPCYLVIYCNAVMEPVLRERREPFISITKFIIQEFDELWCYPLVEQVKKNENDNFFIILSNNLHI